MNDTTTRIPEGSRVLYVGGGDENNPSLIGRFGTVTQDDGTITLPYYVRFETTPTDTWWCPREALVIVPAVGDKVRALKVPFVEQHDGAVCTVTSVEMNSARTGPHIRGEFQSKQKPDDTESWSFHEWEPVTTLADVMDGHTLTVSTPEGRMDAALQRRIDELEHELARANERVEEYASRAGKWERDFGRYAERVMQEAIDRDWCSEYERVVDDIRGSLEIAEIPDREVEVDIDWEETYTVTVRRSATVTLQSGYGEYEIEEAARSRNNDSDADRSDVLDAVRNGNYESCEYVDGSASEG